MRAFAAQRCTFWGDAPVLIGGYKARLVPGRNVTLVAYFLSGIPARRGSSSPTRVNFRVTFAGGH